MRESIKGLRLLTLGLVAAAILVGSLTALLTHSAPPATTPMLNPRTPADAALALRAAQSIPSSSTSPVAALSGKLQSRAAIVTAAGHHGAWVVFPDGSRVCVGFSPTPALHASSTVAHCAAVTG